MGAQRRAWPAQSRLVVAAVVASLFAGPLLGAGVALGFSPPTSTTLFAPSETGRGFTPAVRPRSAFDVRALAAEAPGEPASTRTAPFLTRPRDMTASPDAPSPQVYGGPAPVQATLTANPAAARPGFQGLSQASGPDTGYDPPDPWVAAGPNHLVQAVNTSLRVTDRSGGSPTSVSLGAFFGTGGLPVADPRVIYDSLHGRWLASALFWDCDAGAGAFFGHGYLAMSVSDTSDPLGTWTGLSFEYPDYLPDYPAPGTSSDKVAITANVFAMTPNADCTSGAGYAGADIIVMDWTALLGAGDRPYDYYFTSANYFTPRVAVQAPATSSSLLAVVQKVVASQVNVYFWTFTGLVGPGGGTSATEVDLTAANVIQDFRDPIDPRQPSGTVTSQIDSRPTDAVWRSDLLTFVSTQACTPTGDSMARDCVRVSQLNTSTTTPTVAQDFLIAETGADSYFGGVGMAGSRALFAVWTRSSSTAGAYPSSYGAYHLPTDAPNSISPPELLAAGLANHTGGRWGDYVGVTPDPVDAGAVWQANEYASVDGGWATLVSQLKSVVTGATFVPLTPARLLDSRVGNGLSGPFQALTPRTFQVTGRGGVPSDATAVTGNLTSTNQTGAGFVFLGPNPEPNPSSSTLNFPVGDTRANGVTVALSATGSLSATFGYAGSTDLIFDVTGYFAAPAP